MGSFSYKCSLSGLPIEGGDPVRFLMVTQNPFNDRCRCYHTDLWFPRTYPLKGKYDDYGSVEDIEDGPAKDLWLETLKFDLIELGVGDNSIHDVATSCDMTFDQLLNALWEARVLVKSDVPAASGIHILREIADKHKELIDALDDTKPIKIKKEKSAVEFSNGLPTIKNIQSIVGDNFLVDEEKLFSIRVRYDSYDRDAILPNLSEAKLKVEAAGFAAMITDGSGSYSMGAELLVRPLPNKNSGLGRDTEQKRLYVRQCMIREDVWQATIKIGLEYEPDFYDKINDPGENILPKNHIPATVGIETQWYSFFKKENLTEEQKKRFKRDAADFAIIDSVMAHTGTMWQEGSNSVPQFGEFGLHSKLLKAFSDISENKLKSRQLDD